MTGQTGTRRLAIGIDVGGTKIAGGLIDPETGEIVARRDRPTLASRGGAAVLDDAVAMATDLHVDAVRDGVDITGIGVGVAELVDPDGVVRSGDVVGWLRLPVAERFGPIAPVRIESDVRAGALAEARLGAGAGVRHVVYVTIGTGVSSCLVIDGVPFGGARGNALVLASGPTTCQCPSCGAVSTMVLEEYASGAGIAARYAAATGQPADGARAVVAAADAGDTTAQDVLATAAAALGSAIGLLLNVTDPDLLVLGGGLGAPAGPFQDPLVQAIRAHVWSPATRALPILPAAFGPDSGLIGAGLVGARAAPDQAFVAIDPG